MRDQTAGTTGIGDPDIVQLRWLAVDDRPLRELAEFLALLDASEQARAARFHFEHDRRSYILAHALTRLLLSSRSNLPPQAWRFQTGRYGKPQIAVDGEAAMLRFNLSHTRGMVAVAVARGWDVGIDVERIENGRLSPDLATKTFAPAEAEYLSQLPLGAQTEAALTLWTLKEAYIKSTGLGLSCPLDAFAFTLDPLGIRFMPPVIDDPASWLFRTLKPSLHFVLALAVRSAQPSIVRIDARGLDLRELAAGLYVAND